MAGGTPFRFAMAYDVIHNHYEQHAHEYLVKKCKQCNDYLKAHDPDKTKPAAPTVEYLNQMDDLAASLARLDRNTQAIATIQQKLDCMRKYKFPVNIETLEAEAAKAVEIKADPHSDPNMMSQKPAPEVYALYTSYANLGTFLMREGMNKAALGDATGKAQLEEGLKYIRKGMFVYRRAHFGRESWQVAFGDHFLCSLDDPELLLKRDMVGNSLDASAEFLAAPWKQGWGESAQLRSLLGIADTNLPIEKRLQIREWIAPFRSLHTSVEANGSATNHSPPFDEPALAILGLWTSLFGPNPHLALALGGIMERVGGYDVAWDCYERAQRMMNRFSQDPKIQDRFVAYCKARQAMIEKTMAKLFTGSGRLMDNESLMNRFEESIRRGGRFQAKLAEHEASKISEGLTLEKVDQSNPYLPSDLAETSVSQFEDLELASVSVVTQSSQSRLWEISLTIAMVAAGIGALVSQRR